MEREQDARLQELKDKGVPIYSFSRLETINRCLYESYLTYVKGDRGENNIYAIAGGKCHDVLEQIMNNQATEADLLPTIQEELDLLDTLGIAFPKDMNGEDSIRNNWIANMTHFCTTYKAPKGKFETETLFIYKTPQGNYLQGYIDLTKLNADGSISIYDYKTSSMYSKADMWEHGRQLVLYALGKMQEGYHIKEVAWIMLKYVNVKFMGKKTAKSKEKTELCKTIERRKIGKELAQYVESDLIDAGYDEIDIQIYLDYLEKDNQFTRLPEQIAAKYIILPCVMKWELTDEVLNECNEYIDTTIQRWESLNTSNLADFPPRKFTKINKFGKEVNDYFFCTNLCGHAKTCSYLRDFLDQFNESTEEDDLF